MLQGSLSCRVCSVLARLVVSFVTPLESFIDNLSYREFDYQHERSTSTSEGMVKYWNPSMLRSLH